MASTGLGAAAAPAPAAAPAAAPAEAVAGCLGAMISQGDPPDFQILPGPNILLMSA